MTHPILRFMELTVALQSTNQILFQEAQRPTVFYDDLGVDWVSETKWLTAALKAGEVLKPEALAVMADGSRRLNIFGMRSQTPRRVSETPQQYRFRSLNYDLLLKVFDQVHEDDQLEFIAALRKEIETKGDTAFPAKDYFVPVVAGKVSSFPLIAEFLIRTGHTKELFETVGQMQIPTMGVAIMLTHLVDLIAFNFTLFSEAEYTKMTTLIYPFRERAHLQTHAAFGYRGQGIPVSNPHHKPGRETEAHQIVTSIDSIMGLITEAQYLYLKGALQDSPNVEIQNDKLQVEGFLNKLGFSKEMVGALNAAESEYRSTANAFELKNCLGILRSFLEHLHRESVRAIATAAGDTVPDKWGPATDYLSKKGFFTKQHEAFITSLYTMISDESVHSLGAERLYARLLRNVVIEYGFMFLNVLDKKAVTIQPVTAQTTTDTPS
jgi:hypothetical protein